MLALLCTESYFVGKFAEELGEDNKVTIFNPKQHEEAVNRVEKDMIENVKKFNGELFEENYIFSLADKQELEQIFGKENILKIDVDSFIEILDEIEKTA